MNSSKTVDSPCFATITSFAPEQGRAPLRSEAYFSISEAYAAVPVVENDHGIARHSNLARIETAVCPSNIKSARGYHEQ